jgi:7-alpha-hydroxysteroid dehydrogenase
MSIAEHFSLAGKVSIITGGSRGIGEATAKLLSEMGSAVVLGARSPDDLEQAGGNAVAVTCDLRDLDQVHKLVQAADEHFGGVDVVINNVGGSMPKAFLETEVSEFEEALHFNAATAFALTRAAAPNMLERGGGAVVNVSSAMGSLIDRGYAAYGTGKAALSQLTRLMAADLAPRIRVNAVAPGSVATDALQMVLNPEMEQLMIRATPMRRLGRVEDIAMGIAFLASDAASYVTGAVLPIDGGITFPNLSLGLPDV